MTRPAGEALSVRVCSVLAKDAASPFSLDVNILAEPGFTILFGASGAGKTTLLDCVAGLREPQSGRIAIGDSVLFDSDARVNLRPNRRERGIPSSVAGLVSAHDSRRQRSVRAQ